MHRGWVVAGNTELEKVFRNRFLSKGPYNRHLKDGKETAVWKGRKEFPAKEIEKAKVFKAGPDIERDQNMEGKCKEINQTM